MSEIEQGLVLITPLAGNFDPIELRGTALPFRPASLGGTQQRLKTTHYVGNPVGTQTAGGPVKLAVSWAGRWMDVDLGEGAARALVLQFEALAERAIPLEVRWGGRQLSSGEDPAIVRRGKIAKFEPRYHQAGHIEWTCDFEWSGEALQTKAPTFSKAFAPSMDFSALSEQLGQTLDETQSWRDVAWTFIGSGAGVMLTVFDALDDVQNAIVAALAITDAATGMLVDSAEMPSQVLDRIQGICDRIIVSCEDARAAHDDAVGLWAGPNASPGSDRADAGRAFQSQARRAKLALFPTDDPLARLDSQDVLYDLVLSWDLLAAQAAITSVGVAGQQVPDIIAIERPPVGSDLRDLAVKYYANADDWDIIADYNDLPDSEVPANPSGPSDDGGPPIYIPRLPDMPSQLRRAAP